MEREGACVRAAGEAAQAQMDVYLGAFDGGQSLVVRPVAAFDGLSAAVAGALSLTARPALVTDLATGGERAAGAGVGGQILAYFTSGSTGSPKCVIYDGATIRGHAEVVASALALTASQRYVALPPPRFAYGLSIVHSHHLAGVPVTFLDAEWGLPGLADLLAEDQAPLHLYLLPQHVPSLLAAEIDPSRLERVLVAGGRISGAAVQALAARFPAMSLTNMFGQAEMGPRLAMWQGRPAEFVEGLIGHPIDGANLRLADTAGGGEQPAPLLAGSRHAMTACLRPPYAHVEPGPGAVGVVDTGDLARRRPDGAFLHQGRGDHILNVAGTKVDLRRVAALIQEAFAPLLVRIDQRPSRTGGDAVPVIEIVPGSELRGTGAVRRVLHTEFGALAGLFDIRLVDRPTVKESGK